MGLVNGVLNLLFPSYCVSCGKQSYDFCMDCLASLGPAERECPKWIFPLYDYRHPSVKKAVWFLKYKRRKKLAAVMAEALYGRIVEELADLMVLENFDSPILIPVPLSPSRLRERGYNQAEIICRELIKIDDHKNFKLDCNVLFKPKDSPHQAHIENRRERLQNIVGTFALKNTGYILGKNIILIDDVITTGATLSEARKVLREAGARKVIAFTFAH
jgi:competence protein ComFC